MRSTLSTVALWVVVSGRLPENRVAVERRNSAGISIVANHIGAVAPRLLTTETRRIGLIEGPEPYLFA